MKYIYKAKCLIALIFLFSIHMTINAQVSQTEFEALLAFYKATDGDNWTNNTGWDTTATANDVTSSWQGVTVSNGHVTQLYFSYNNLTGTFPSQIGSLSYLTYLNLNSNNLSGSIPAEIGNLLPLTNLETVNNKLTGAIPSEIGELTNLEYLNLSVNDLTDSIPQSIGQLTKLEYLNLQCNFTGEIPQSIGNLVNLKTLLLGGELTGSIPSEIGNLTKLEALEIPNCSLSGSIPDEIGNLSNLTGLNLKYNNLSGSIPAGLGNLSKLLYVYLDSNKFSVLPDLSALSSTVQHFDIQNNEFTFEDLESNIDILRTYSPQAKVGEEQNISVDLGQSKILSVTVGGENNIYQWYKDDEMIEGATQKDFEITDFKEQDEGVYNCKINNTIATGLTLESYEITLTVTNNIQQFTVTFVDYDASVLKTETVDYGNDATAPTEPTRTGYTFTGWDVDFTNVASDLTVTAQYKVTTSIIKTEENSLVVYPNPVSNGILYIKANTPIHELYLFDLLGNKIYISSDSRHANSIDVSSLPSGVYYIKIDNVTQKVIVE